jgi:hypothetical protein
VQSAIEELDTEKEPAFSKNTAFNKNFGTAVTEVAYGNHNHSGVYEPADATILKESDVVDNLTTTTTTVPLSANQGYNLDLEQKRMKGIYLDLPYLYNHNTKLIATCESDEAWTDGKWSGTGPATHADDITNYKVGSQGISITTTSTAFERTKVSKISKACSPVSGCEISISFMLTPIF